MARDWIHHNLHTGRVSVRPAGQPGGKRRVTITADAVIVRNATPHVSAAGRARVVEKGSRDVHATIRGTAVAVPEVSHGPFKPSPHSRRISYNPFRSGAFHYADTGEEWKGSAAVLVTGGYAYEL